MLSSLHLIQLTVSIFAAFAVSRVYLRLREGAVALFSFLFWTFIWLGAALLVWFPSLSSPVARFLGIGRGADAFFFLSILLLFYLIYRIYVKLEKIEREITKAVRQQALDDKEKTAM